ncbi:hypothetical protein [Luteolibacter sp. Populi]|uniref:hypothetical protein n=1 Tax=Luteolibacter sp. Populi TaxID=3230487 RepID=UPI0034664669
MDLITRLQELPSHKYAIAGVCLVIVIGFLLKLGWGLLMKAVFLGVFVVLALVVLLAVQG